MKHSGALRVAKVIFFKLEIRNGGLIIGPSAKSDSKFNAPVILPHGESHINGWARARMI